MKVLLLTNVKYPVYYRYPDSVSAGRALFRFFDGLINFSRETFVLLKNLKRR